MEGEKEWKIEGGEGNPSITSEACQKLYGALTGPSKAFLKVVSS